MNKVRVLVLLLVVALASVLFAQTAEVVEVAGKVEYQIPGRDWRPARVGDLIPAKTVISTGFKSSAKLRIANSIINVNPVTWLTLEDLIQTQSGSQTQLFLISGRISADVTPQPNLTTDFKISSPTATASVRGTSFQFDGLNLLVERGIVDIRTLNNQFRRVRQGEFTYVANNGQVATPAAVSQGRGFSNIGQLISEVINSDVGGSIDPGLVITALLPLPSGTLIPPDTPEVPEEPTGTMEIILE
ncbi:MAG: FecR family protein [Spirochaetes bacterium]|nr:FecR family protein [Spirochaetota bacterium]MBU0955675.1 FecR family protein [Spirochaetota bacterium]